MQETIDYLKALEPMGTMKWSPLLAAASKFHVEDHGPKGLTGHDSSDGTSMSDRLKKFC